MTVAGVADTVGVTPLKRLGFVKHYAIQGEKLFSNVYSTVRSFVPGFVEPYVEKAEETASNLGAPYVAWAQDTAEKVVKGVDDQVDYGLNTLDSAVSYGRKLHGKGLDTFNSAKDQYFSFVADLLDLDKWTKWTSANVEHYVNPDLIVDTGAEYYSKVASFGPVPKAIEIADPLIHTYVKTYSTVHDKVVSLPIYKKLWELVWGTSNTLQESWPAKKAIELGYPVVAPIADPVYNNFTKSKYLKQLEAHLKPAHTI